MIGCSSSSTGAGPSTSKAVAAREVGDDDDSSAEEEEEVQQNGGMTAHPPPAPLEQWKMLNSLVKKKREPLERDRRLLEAEEHPEYLRELAGCRERLERGLRRAAELEKREAARIEAEYQREKTILEREYQSRVNELVDSLLQEMDEGRRQLDGVMAGDLGQFGASTSSWTHPSNMHAGQWGTGQGVQGVPGKKQLRRRPNDPPGSSVPASAAGTSSAAEQSTVPEKKARKRSPGAGQTCPMTTQTLLKAQEIAQDVEIFLPTDHNNPRHSSSSRGSVNSLVGSTHGQNASHSEHHQRGEHGGEEGEGQQQGMAGGRKPRKVVLDQGRMRMVCDGKNFTKMQNVFIQSANTGWKQLSARIMQITDLTIQFRSVIPGDTRTVTASKEDLESGRVLVWKRY